MKTSLAVLIVLFILAIPSAPAPAQVSNAGHMLVVHGIPSVASAPAGAVRAIQLLSSRVSADRRSVDLAFTLRQRGPVTIELIGTDGKHTPVPAAGHDYTDGDQHVSIAVDELRSGSYLVRLSTPNGLAQNRIEIAR